MLKKIFLLIIGSLFLVTIFGIQFRVMTYNTLYDWDGNISMFDKADYFQTVIEDIDPDILLVQEINSHADAVILLSTIYEINDEYEMGTFVDGPGGPDCHVYYKPAIAEIDFQNALQTPGRNIMEYAMEIDGNPIRFYSVHLKAGNSPEDAQQRYEEVCSLREHIEILPVGIEFIIAGDLNVYSSSDAAYQRLVEYDAAFNNGRADDLCSQVGNWHENSYYSEVHSQSTRTSDFGGGSAGGMDDRFDLIFGSYNLNNSENIEYILGSYNVWGNDGNHFNQAVNSGTNQEVSSEVANALYYASDHLPVFADFVTNGDNPGIIPIADIQENTDSYEGQNVTIEGFGTIRDIDAAACILENVVF